jgi:ParB/RepB/Spo0J family partition protein
MSAEHLEGFWTHPQNSEKSLYHFFVEGDESSICGRFRLREMHEERVIRCPGGEGCQKCADIHQELYAVDLTPAEPEPNWTVKTDPVTGNHTLFYQGKPQSTVRGPTGLATQNELAVIFNRAGSVPKPRKKTRCAADAPDAGKYVAKHAAKSPELPLPLNPQPTTNNSLTMSAKAKALTPPPVDVALPPAGEIPANLFRPSPENRRITPDQIAKMSTSIRDVGVLQPITARIVENTETGAAEYEIVLGECRWRGCLDIDENYPVPCFVRSLTDKEAAKIRAIENFQRKDLDEIEEARAIQNLKDTGWTIDEIMNFLGRKKDYIYERLTLLKLSDDAHVAFREGNITMHTAVKIASLPEDQRADALRAVASPVHSAKALPEREALRLIDDKFIEPQKKSEEWEARRDAILQNHPRAKWLPYPEARKLAAYNSGYVETEDRPTYQFLSDAARAEELVVPTWGELAAKHGAALVIGVRSDGEAVTYVQEAPLVEAEKAACNANPQDCIFTHEDAVQKSRDAAEKRKLEEAAHREALKQETTRLQNMILAPDGMKATTVKKFVESCYSDIYEFYVETDDLGSVLGIPQMNPDDEVDEWSKKIQTAVTKYLRSKAFTPFEAMARLQAACAMRGCQGGLLSGLFDSGACKSADYPAHYQEFLGYQERMQKFAAAAELTSNKDAA